MAIQQWTIIKLVGPAAVDALQRFNVWQKTRRSADPHCWSAADWHASTRKAIGKYFAHVLQKRQEMPIAYFSQHTDYWLAGNEVAKHLADTDQHIFGDNGEWWCYALPDRGRLVRRNAALLKSAGFLETAWLATRLIEAAHAYRKLWPTATLLIHRQATSASPTDDELKIAANELPNWAR